MALVTLVSDAALSSVGGGSISLALNSSDSQLFGITNFPSANSVTSADLSYSFSITGANNDTYELYISIVASDGTTILAGQTSTTDYKVADWLVDSLSSGSGTVTFPFIQTLASQWTGAQVRLRQVYSQAQGKDGTNYVVDQASVELDFVGLDALSANDIQTLPSVVDIPTFNQSQILNANDLESSSEVSNPEYVDTVELLSEAIESLSSVESSAFNQTQILNSENLDSLSSVESSAFNQNQILNSENLESLSSVESSAFNQTQILNSENLESLSSVESSAFNQNQILNSENLESLSSVESSAFNQTQTLEANNIESISEAPPGIFSEIKNFNATSIESSTSVSNPFFEDYLGIRSLTEVSSPSLQQNHSLGAENIESSSSIEFFYASFYVNLPDNITVFYVNA